MKVTADQAEVPFEKLWNVATVIKMLGVSYIVLAGGVLWMAENVAMKDEVKQLHHVSTLRSDINYNSMALRFSTAELIGLWSIPESQRTQMQIQRILELQTDTDRLYLEIQRLMNQCGQPCAGMNR